jgi:hypothetical protein
MPYKSKEKAREYRLRNKEILKQRQREHYLRNTEKIKSRQKEYRERNKEDVARRKKEYVQNNKEKHIEYRRKLYAYKMKNNKDFRLKKALRQRVYFAVKSLKTIKSKKTMELLGCSIDELKIHLESKFKEGMNWENYGLKGWHIDHIVPCASFDLTKEEEQRKCFHYTNLQPLWWMDNIKKSDKIL